MNSNIWILGVGDEPIGTDETTSTTTTPTDPNAGGAGDGKTGGPGMSQLILIGLMFVVMYMILFRGPKKKQQQHKQMVQKLQKNDKVQTIGGIIGTVVDIRENEIVLKIDESNNTKMRVSPNAIGRSIAEDKK